MNRVLRTDYQAVNSRGVAVYTFSDFEVGKQWVRDNAHLHDGLILEEVTITARRVYRPRAPRQFDALSIPAFRPAMERA